MDVLAQFEIKNIFKNVVGAINKAAASSDSLETFRKKANSIMAEAASENNLPPAMVERMVHHYNTAASTQALRENVTDFATLDPSEIVQGYGNYLPKAASAQKIKTAHSFNEVDVESADLSEMLYEGFGDRDDTPVVIHRIVKSASLEPAPEDPLEVLFQNPELLSEFVNEHTGRYSSALVKAASICRTMDPEDCEKFLQDSIDFHSDKLPVIDYMAGIFKRAGKLKVAATLPATSADRDRHMPSYSGLRDLLQEASVSYEILESVRHKQASWNNQQTQNPPKQNKGGQGSSGGKSGSSPIYVPNYFNFNPPVQPETKKPEPSREAGSRPPSGGGFPLAPRIFDSLLEGSPAPTYDKDMAEIETEISFRKILEDEVIRDHDPYDAQQAFNRFMSHAPSLARDPGVATIAVRAMLNYQGIDPATAQMYAQAEAARRGILQGRLEFKSQDGRS
jgi:hypothetical protein